MEKKEILKKIEEINNIYIDLENKINLIDKKNRIKELETISSDVDFWNDIEKTKDVISELKNLRKIVESFDEVKDKIDLISEMLSLDITDEELLEIENELNSLEPLINELKLDTLLSDEYDENNAYIEIHSGAGGTESNDWANMLYRMYTRFFEKNDYTYEVINEQSGEEVGIKGVTLLVKGYYPYGMLKGETGVHRLVRISPFDSGNRRHTSFASVLVTPEIKKNMDIEIKESDIKIDVFHSSGAGGQSVNTSDSAVRITHLPTKIVVSCQVERSQLQNKARALDMLKQKLFMLSMQNFKDKLKSLKGEVMDVNFGSAIRSYVMCPYTLVKDTRTNYETSNVDKILDGDIKEMLEEYLKI